MDTHPHLARNTHLAKCFHVILYNPLTEANLLNWVNKELEHALIYKLLPQCQVLNLVLDLFNLRVCRFPLIPVLMCTFQVVQVLIHILWVSGWYLKMSFVCWHRCHPDTSKYSIKWDWYKHLHLSTYVIYKHLFLYIKTEFTFWTFLFLKQYLSGNIKSYFIPSLLLVSEPLIMF